MWGGGYELPLPVREAILATPSPFRCVSAISSIEIAIKYRKGLLPLPLRPEAWLDEFYSRKGITVLPVTHALCCVSAELPLLHRDPMDRIIIATAHQYGRCPILTSDTLIAKYPNTEVIWQ